jgi:hypothetical protein
MNSKELFAHLAREGFNPLCYRVEAWGGEQRADDCYCLGQVGALWEVSYLERGSRQTLASFSSEAEACDHLLAQLEREPSARSHLLTWFSEKSESDRFVATLLQSGIKPTHRDAPAFADRTDIRYRVFVDGRDLDRATILRDSIVGAGAPIA